MSAVFCITPKRFQDQRGWFSETYNRSQFLKSGKDIIFVQDNQSFSQFPYTLRGLHFQVPPHAQDKLVRCTRGRIYDVAIDVRRGSPTYGKWVGLELTADNGKQLLVPKGFAHGFLTLEPNTEAAYKVSDFYAPACDAGFRWDDPAIKVDWPLPPGAAPLLSAKDERLPMMEGFVSTFSYDGEPLDGIRNVE
jgi:dTDP-4-dehydrorhamnose 3,5-epimerase